MKAAREVRPASARSIARYCAAPCAPRGIRAGGRRALRLSHAPRLPGRCKARAAASDDGVSSPTSDALAPVGEVVADAKPQVSAALPVTQLPAPPLVAPVAQKAGWPPVVWFGIGIGAVVLYQKVTGFFTGGGLQKMMMKQMMKNMGAGGMPGQAPPNPFAAAGGFPGAAPGAAPGSPFAGSPFGGMPTPTPTPQPAATTTTATEVDPSPAAVATPEGATEAPAAPKRAKAAAGAKASAFADPPAEEKKPAKNVFQDVSSEQAEPKAFTPRPVDEAATTTPSGGASFDPSAVNPEVVNFAAGAAGGASGEGGGMMDLVEQMMQDPKMQEMMYPYLPEGMRNPETFKWILQNPEMRQQMEQMLAQGMPGGASMNPEMMNMMNMDGDEFKKQFDQVGMSPDEVLKKIMENPELSTAFQNPRVQQAMMDCSSNPMNISKYTGDKEVMDAMMKMAQLFPAQNMPNMPNMPQ